jgi:hypothetical protein
MSTRGWVRRVLGSLWPPAPPAPPPDPSCPAAYPGETVVETILATDQAHRVAISRDARGLFRVHLEQWDTSDWDVVGQVYWTECAGNTITDTLPSARRLAEDALQPFQRGEE